MKRRSPFQFVLCGAALAVAAFSAFGQSEEILVNKRPLRELSKRAGKIAENGSRPTTPFRIQAKFTLTKDGKIDPNTLEITKCEGDERMSEIARTSIVAVSESGYLQYLTLLSGKTIELDFSQDESSVNASVASELESETRAASVSTLLSMAISEFKKKKERTIAEMRTDPAKALEVLNETDELELLKATKVKSVGTRFVIQFMASNETAARLLDKLLAAPALPEN